MSQARNQTQRFPYCCSSFIKVTNSHLVSGANSSLDLTVGPLLSSFLPLAFRISPPRHLPTTTWVRVSSPQVFRKNATPSLSLGAQYNGEHMGYWLQRAPEPQWGWNGGCLGQELGRKVSSKGLWISGHLLEFSRFFVKIIQKHTLESV